MMSFWSYFLQKRTIFAQINPKTAEGGSNPGFYVTFNIIINHIFPEKFIEIALH